MSFYCIKLSGLYKLFQTSGNFTKFRQGNQGIIKDFFFRHLAGNPGLLNKIHQIIYDLYQAKVITKKVYSSIMNAIKL